MTTPATELRAAAGRTTDTTLAALLTTLADAADSRDDSTHGVVATLLHPALAVARQILGTTDQQPEAARFCGRADCLAPGHRFMLGTTVHTCAGKPETVPDDRRARYAAAMALRDGHPKWPTEFEDDERNYQRRADAAIALADTEIKSARDELSGAYTGAAALRDEVAELRAVRTELIRQRDQIAMDTVKALPAPVGRAAVLRETADHAESLRQFDPVYGARKGAQISENLGILRVADSLRRMADEAQQPTPAPAEETKPETFREWLGRQRVAGTGTGVQLETEAPPVCGDRSPVTGALCQRSPSHTYPHRDAKQKGTETSSWWGGEATP